MQAISLEKEVKALLKKVGAALHEDEISSDLADKVRTTGESVSIDILSHMVDTS